jgi:predicted dipeptidase
MNNQPDFKKEIERLKDELIADIGSLVEIKSVRDLSSQGKDSPFGTGIRRAFDRFREIAENKGFLCEDFGGYALHAKTGEAEEYIAILGHLDTVEEIELDQWDFDPFVLSEHEGILYGRGVNDDKGPLLAGMYAAYIIKQMGFPLKRSIRIIAGGAEETTWECMDHYFRVNSQPRYGFSPDGNFPIINGEKGILNVRIDFRSEEGGALKSLPIAKIISPTSGGFVCNQLEVEINGKNLDRYVPLWDKASQIMTQNGEGILLNYTERKTLSRNPERGENAIFDFLDDFNIQSLSLHPIDEVKKDEHPGNTTKNPALFRVLDYIEKYLYRDPYGKKLGLYSEDKEMGLPSVCPSALVYEEGKAVLYLEIRYTKSTTAEEILDKLETSLSPYGGMLSVSKTRKLLYVPEDSELIKALKTAYEKVTGEKAEVFTKGGASYARVLKEGVAFGPTFEGETANSHLENERISIASLLKATEIYCEALYLLACK